MIRIIHCAVAITAGAAAIVAQAEQIYERRMGDWSVSCQAEEYGFQGCEGCCHGNAPAQLMLYAISVR